MKNTRTLLAIITLLAMMVSLFTIPTYAAEYKDGDVLYENDFSSFDVGTLEPYGYAYAGGATKAIEVKDGALCVDNDTNVTDGTRVSGRYGTRFVLYDIPEDVKTYSITADIKINEYKDTASDSIGPGLLIADDKVVDADTTTKNGAFSMFWMRQAGLGTSGIYTYGDTSFNVVSKAETGFCESGTWYTVQIFIDITNPEDPIGMFKATHNNGGFVYETDYFYFNSLGLNNIVGIYNNGCNISVDNVKVTYGNAYFEIAPEVEDTTAAPVETTAAPAVEDTTAAPAVEDTTAAPAVEDTTAAPEAEGGCGALIGGGIVVATAILGSAWVSKRR